MPKELKPFYNPGPGDIIRDAMEELGWNQADLAEITGLTEKSINLIINNKQAITPETATLLGQVFSTPAEMWLNLQARYDLRKIDDQDSPKKELAEQKAVLRKYMPVGEIKKKGWFQYDVSTIEGIRRECRRVFGQDSVPVKEYEKQKTFAARQTRFDYQYTLWYCHTWFEYAKLNAHEIAEKLPAYNQEKLSQIAGNFASYTLREDGINKIIKDLFGCGVGFFVQSHLSKTYLDGAAFVFNEKPFIVYTGRYDRVDNFWFVLAHEISHILLHFDGLQQGFLDNLEEAAETKRESEADKNANNMLNADKVIAIGKLYGKYLTSDRLATISRESGVALPVALGILQHAGIIEWRQFSRYRKKVMEVIPEVAKRG